ncbi:50S ribosomal protein L25 [Stratiformator vulcanicus]|uniref:Large ribosomal subunit protein bL25 n=1 Tax=Stratiformator vulcanicus TaxID=2527980 RepID=A0A517R6B8_9PLAN|nr:50S ribosomal protein L25 [Stratiformator vulcanicus]QDT39428.1 50S ribosomal protein L25 [Stratiformator vulcanicus]
MSDAEHLSAEPRSKTGSIAARRLRQNAQIPGNVYGHGEGSVAIAAPRDRIDHLVHGGHHIVQLELEGETQQTLLREVQWDAFGQEVLHFDLQRVSSEEKIQLEVPVVTTGEAPGVVNGGLLDVPLHSLEIECPAGQVPDQITVNINQLKIGDGIQVRDLNLPEGVSTTANPDDTVVHVLSPKEMASAEDIEDVVDMAVEPELIRKDEGDEEAAAKADDSND